jgi:hypothetical protein
VGDTISAMVDVDAGYATTAGMARPPARLCLRRSRSVPGWYSPAQDTVHGQLISASPTRLDESRKTILRASLPLPASSTPARSAKAGTEFDSRVRDHGWVDLNGDHFARANGFK